MCMHSCRMCTKSAGSSCVCLQGVGCKELDLLFVTRQTLQIDNMALAVTALVLQSLTPCQTWHLLMHSQSIPYPLQYYWATLLTCYLLAQHLPHWLLLQQLWLLCLQLPCSSSARVEVSPLAADPESLPT